MHPSQPKLSLYFWTGLVLCSVLLALGLAITGAILYHAQQTKTLRCYWIDPPLTHTELALLNSKTYTCTVGNCRAVAQTIPGRGVVCYFPRPFPYPQQSNVETPRRGVA